MSGFIDRVPITKEPKRENLMQGSCCQREVKVQRGGKGNPEISTSKKPVVGRKGRGEVIGAQDSKGASRRPPGLCKKCCPKQKDFLVVFLPLISNPS